MRHAGLLRSPEMQAILMPSARASQPSAWHGHVSFAHWLIEAARPRIVVELGTHHGVSFAAFCMAASQLGLPTRCFAVDTWQGDDHTGPYPDQIFGELSTFIQRRFGEIGTLVRSTFRDALSRFEPGSVDVLHIDGLHTYEAVRDDYETWRPKLSSQAVVLFHDIAVIDRDFGVWKIWDELRQDFPHFSFGHSAGLGVLVQGPKPPEPLLSLCRAEGTEEGALLRALFEDASSRAQKHGMNPPFRPAERAVPAGLTNVAVGCTATQSSAMPEFPPRHPCPGTVKDGSFGFHTLFEPDPWLIVDLGTFRALELLVVYNRLDEGCRDRAKTLRVDLSDDGSRWRNVYGHDGPAFGGVDGFPLQIELAREGARFVRLRLQSTEFFHLDQIEIYERSATSELRSQVPAVT